MLGRNSQLSVHVKNNGILPATGRVDMESHHAFSLECDSRIFSVESKKVEKFDLTFHPKQIGSFRHNVEVKVCASLSLMSGSVNYQSRASSLKRAIRHWASSELLKSSRFLRPSELEIDI